MKRKEIDGKNLLTIILLVCLIALCVFFETGCYSDNRNTSDTLSGAGPKRNDAREESYWAKDLDQKMDKAIAIMNIIKEDIKELDEAGVANTGSTTVKPFQTEKTKGEELRNNIDKMVKVLNVIRDDIGEIEKMDEGKQNQKQ